MSDSSNSISSKFKEKNINIKDYSTISLAIFKENNKQITDYLKEGKSPVKSKTVDMTFNGQNYKFYTVKFQDIKKNQTYFDIGGWPEEETMTEIKNFIKEEIRKQGSQSPLTGPHIKDPQKGGKKTRKHKGIVQIGGNIGRLRKGYKYSGKRTKTGLAEIMSV